MGANLRFVLKERDFLFDASKNRLDCIRKNRYVILCSTERT